MSYTYAPHDENPRLRAALENAQRHQKEGWFLVTRPGQYGLGDWSDWDMDRRYGTGYYSSPTIISHYGDVTTISSESPLEIYGVKPFDIKTTPEKLIDERPLVVAKCKIICATRLAIVEGKDSNGEDWRAEFSDVDITQHPYNLLREINNMLQSQRHRIVVTDIQWDAEPKAADKLVAPQLGNNQVLAPLTGYAVNSQGNLMIYASVVTNDETRRSLGATFGQGKYVYISGAPEYQCPSGNNYIHCSSVGKGRYTSLQVKIPKLSKYSCAFFVDSVTAGEAGDTVVYALAFDGSTVSPTDILYSRCQEIVVSSLLDSWKDAVINAATSKNLITPLTVWGDCTHGWAIATDRKPWTAMLNEMLTTKRILVK
jgi:hypothetical protein